MRGKFRILITLVLQLLCFPLQPQNLHQLDSLNYLLETATSDSIKVRRMIDISREYSTNNIPLSLDYAERALDLSESTKDKELIAYSLFNIAISYFNQGLVEFSIKYFYQYIDIQKEIDNKKGLAYALVNLGAVCLVLEEFEQSKEHFENALETFNELAMDSTK